MADSKRFWNRIAKNYAKQDDSEDDKNYKLLIEKSVKYMNSTDILLDYACGPGTASFDLSPFVKRVWAIDISENMIEIARGRAEERSIANIDFAVADIFDQQLGEHSFNNVTAFNILHLLDNIDDSLFRVQKLLKEGGLFISLTDSGSQMGKLTAYFFRLLSKTGIIPYFRQYSSEELRRRMVACGFSILVCEPLYEASGNSFIIARKEKS